MSDEDIQRLENEIKDNQVDIKIILAKLTELDNKIHNFMIQQESVLEKYYINSSETKLILSNKCHEQDEKTDKKISDLKKNFIAWLGVFGMFVGGIVSFITTILKD